MPPGWVGGVVDTSLAGPKIDWATRGNHRCGYHGGGRVPVRYQQAHCIEVQKPQSAGGCWPAAPPLRGPVGVTRRGLPSGVALQELKSSAAWGHPCS